MSNLVPSAITLDKGLDLQTPKLVAAPGTVLDSLNYEQVDFQGQKRIDGYTRYDGSVVANFDDFLVIDVEEEVEDSTSPLLVYSDTELLGLCFNIKGSKLYVAVFDHTVLLDEGDKLRFTVDRSGEGSSLVGSEVTVVSVDDSKSLSTVEQYEEWLNANNSVRSYVEQLPGAIIGLQWFRDRLYAVADMSCIPLDVGSPIYPNTKVVVKDEEENSYEATVVESYTTPEGRVVFLDTNEFFGDKAVTVYDSTGTTRLAGSSETFSMPDATRVLASFWEARTEWQVDDGDYGWKFNHLGWSVRFKNGSSAYGKLISSNMHRENVGTEGPTSIEGSSGSPTTLVQNVNITNLPTQINGWKSNNTSTSYDLNVGAITLTDDAYIYADAYITWNSSGTITTQGSSMSGLTQRPADATVVVSEFED